MPGPFSRDYPAERKEWTQEDWLNSMYETVQFLEKQLRMPRWVEPFHGGLAATSQVFTTARAVMVEFELEMDATVDGLVFIVGSASSGNVRGGIYGPLVTEETCAGATLAVESASTAMGTANTPQTLSLTATRLVAGRYYAALQADNGTGTYMRQANQAQVVGWGQFYDRGGGYGAFTSPCPAVTDTGSALPGVRVRLAQ